MQKFKNDFGLTKYNQSTLFEYFVNNAILSMHQPDCINKRPELLGLCSVGGQNDMGIDGLAIKVNDYFVTTIKEIDDIISISRYINIEFIFIQSKFQDKIDSGDYSKYIDGVYDFLAEKHYEPHNNKIDDLLQLKNYLFSDDIMQHWNTSPIIKSYYAIFGEWRDDEHIYAKSNTLQSKIEDLREYGDIQFRYIGTSTLSKICDENDNTLNIVINSLGSLEFEEVEGVDNSLMVLCKATEFVKILNTDEGLIRKSLFVDNVRDYQGNTTINESMMETLKNDPASFLLLNNGITIVCTSIVTGNRKITLTNPQIVNGCQTSHVLFLAHKQGVNLDNVSIMIKIIATQQDNITNCIVKGTNSQNPVFSQSFETISEFHKNLENFIASIQTDELDQSKKIFYERRSKQYSRDLTISRHRIFSLDMLAHSIISVFLKSPHDSVLHIVKLLEKYNNRIFVDSQSFYPYYTSALMLLNLEKLIRDGEIDHEYEKFKYLLMFITATRISGQPLDINKRNVDELCKKILLVITDDIKYKKELENAIEIFKGCSQKWIAKYGKQYRFGIKDNPTFTDFLIAYMYGGNIENIKMQDEDPEYTGKVISIKQDRKGKYFGFIKAKPENVFFHEADNPQIKFSDIQGVIVTYKLMQNIVNGKTKAKNVTIVE